MEFPFSFCACLRAGVHPAHTCGQKAVNRTVGPVVIHPEDGILVVNFATV